MLRLDFTSQDYLQDPTGGLAKLRAAGLVVAVRFPIVGKTWITTNADLAARVLKDNETFTMRKNGKVAGVRWWMMRRLRCARTARLPVCAGGCRDRYARSQSACCPWTSQTTRDC